MKNKLILIVILILIILIFICLIAIHQIKSSELNNAANNPSTPTNISHIADESEISEINQTDEPEIINIINDFDNNFTNSQGFNSKIVEAEGKIFFLVDRILYCYDTNIDKIVLEEDTMDSYIDEKGIFLHEGYVYYLLDKTINRINVSTLDIEEYLKVKDVYVDIFDGNTPVGWHGEIFNWFLLNNDTIIVSVLCEDGGEVAGAIGAAKIEELDFKRIYYKGGVVLYSDKIIDIEFGYTSIDYNDESYKCNEYLFTEIDLLLNKTSIKDLEFSGDFVFTSSWPKSSNYIYGINYKTGEIIYEHVINSSFASIHGLNQYIIYYYYDRLQLEEYDAKEGAVLVDLKNNIVYTDEAINTIISGDITNYLDLLYMEFYLDGDSVYAIKREQDLVEASYYNDEGDFTMPEITDSFIDDDRDFYISKGYNNNSDRVNLYKIQIVDGKLHFTLLYKEFD